VNFHLVYVDVDAGEDQLAAHAREFGHGGSPLHDKDRRLARWAGARVAPSATVISIEGEVVYLGRIDDRWEELGRQRLAATKFDLREALDAVLAGREVAEPRVRAVGCSIE
jgi:hypothetical protein